MTRELREGQNHALAIAKQVVAQLCVGPKTRLFAGVFAKIEKLIFSIPGGHNIFGLILCQDKNEFVAEYALKGIAKPIGISEYQLTKNLPQEFKSSLPSVEEIEAELGGVDG